MPTPRCPHCSNTGSRIAVTGTFELAYRDQVRERCSCEIGQLVGRTLSDLPADEREAAAALVMAAMDAGRDARNAAYRAERAQASAKARAA